MTTGTSSSEQTEFISLDSYCPAAVVDSLRQNIHCFRDNAEKLLEEDYSNQEAFEWLTLARILEKAANKISAKLMSDSD